jgi:hypothetical protein
MVDLAKIVPIAAISFSVVLTVSYASTTQATAGVPAYAKITLFAYSALNVIPSLTHWLAVPDAGLECIAKLDLGPPSPARTVAIAMHRKEGQERFCLSCVMLYICQYVPIATIPMLTILLVQSLLGKLSHDWYQPMMFQGSNLSRKAPGRYKDMLNICMLGLPVAYAFLKGDL